MSTMNLSKAITGTANPSSESQAALSSKDKALKAGQESAFGSELAQASVLQAQAMVPAAMPTPLKPGAEAQRLVAHEKAGVTALDSAMRAPISQKPAASVNTGTAIAGLKPWSKDWVFQGAEANPDLKPLIETEGDKASLEALRKMQTAPAGAQVPNMEALSNLNGRGDAAAATSALSKKADPALQDKKAGFPQAGAAAAAGTAGVQTTDALLMSQLQKMNGQMEVVEAGEGKQAGKPKAAAVASGAGGLSGGEFLNTMNAVKQGQAGSQQGQLGGQGSQQNPGAQAELTGVKGKPSLKVIEGAKGKKPLSAAGSHDLTSSQLQHASNADKASILNNGAGAAAGAAVMSGHVVKGAMSRDRLATASLQNISTNIRGLSANGGGEIRVRLKPENLGELTLKVSTQGGQVGLQIQASDENAKKIIEESIGSLRDSLATQNLSLSSVDLTVASASGSSAGGESKQEFGQNSQQQAGVQQDAGQNAGQSNGGRNRDGSESGSSAGLASAKAPASNNTASARSAGGRPNGLIDVRA